MLSSILLALLILFLFTEVDTRIANTTQKHIPITAEPRSRRNCSQSQPNRVSEDQPCMLSTQSPILCGDAWNSTWHTTSSTSRQYRIVLSVSTPYLPALFNWLTFYRRIFPCQIADNDNLYFVCLDKSSQQKMAAHGLRCSFAEHSGRNLNKVWLWRVRLTMTLLSQGLDVLISDADAVWLRNPLIYMKAFEFADIITSKGSYPIEISNKYGTAACMGFIYIKATESAKSFWGLLIAAMSKTIHPNDQRSLNYLFGRRSLTFTNAGNHKPSHASDVDDHGFFYAQNQQRVNVTFLAHNRFRRQCNHTSHSELFDQGIVLHCATDKVHQHERESYMRSIGLWLLRDDWATVPSRNITFDDYLNRIQLPKVD